MNYFAGRKVKAHYKKIYDLIFEGKREGVTINAKCDAPEVLRDNILYLTPVYNDPKQKDQVIGILHQSVILKIEVREKPADILRKENLRQEIGGEFLEICSICKFVKYKIGGRTDWISSEKYYQLGGTDDVKLEHSICSDCSVMMDEFM